MKMNKKKILVSTLALAMGAGLAGSVSGTMAWFQYSTRAQAAYIGSVAHCSEALEISCDGGTSWATDLNSTVMNTSKVGGTDMEPITAGAIDADDALPTKFYKNPIYQFINEANWGEADSTNYVQFNLKFRVKDVNSPVGYLSGHHLYLTDLTIANENGATDLYKAVRVHFAVGTSYKLFARNNDLDNANIETSTSGNLDLNNNGRFDKGPGYEWDDRGADLVYGTVGTQTALNANKSGVLANDANPRSIVANSGDLGEITGGESGLAVKVTIWLEGWTKLGNDVAGVDANSDGDYDDDGDTQPTNAAKWDAATYINKAFKVGMRFATEVHGDAE
ncbi:MAG: hypothetical protein IJR08_00185 [Bacilli bacterium]|nr:hypothetical protein [Bacilli bacterium]